MENDAKFHELFLFKLRAYTEEMIRQGINIDTMPKLDFKLFMANKIYFWMMEVASLPPSHLLQRSLSFF